ncbi:hypothetical protein CK503_04610 [Aliifodinibius salipaludis]|uniref:Uncharacterized protein n=1 Tax=Fodinibius salipaludis TaxID=2032627 RepID=A0A2A2GC29_9BACT|nr:hypothetical protein [Aliifodinibius salipaludis]PAU94760.1 hypothetical protein CK503_04610 [Aliifodinibius salipaludis]
MYENIEPNSCNPPGTHLEEVAHAADPNRSIDKAIIMEHRFAFFFWMKWRNLLSNKGLLKQPAPTLVTIDWHRDLAPVPDEQKATLEQLDQNNLSDVSNYVWAQLDQTNDGHIFCAAWLNLIGDIILLQNTTDYQESTFIDKEDNEHGVYEFQDFEQFQEYMTSREDENIFFDVDLDYFIHGKGKQRYSENFRRYSDDEIKQIIAPGHPVFEYMIPRIDGITLAMEPGYCGGIVNSCQIMDVFHSQLFDDQNEWKKHNESTF